MALKKNDCGMEDVCSANHEHSKESGKMLI